MLTRVLAGIAFRCTLPSDSDRWQIEATYPNGKVSVRFALDDIDRDYVVNEIVNSPQP